MSALRFTTKLLAPAAIAAVAVTVPAGVALADAADAPYARAAANVSAHGTLEHGKNILSTYRASTGNYCVRVGSDINLAKAVIQVTDAGGYRATLAAVATPTAVCQSRTDTVTVYSWGYNAAVMDAAFYLSIP